MNIRKLIVMLIFLLPVTLTGSGILYQNLEDILTVNTLVFTGKVINTGWQEDLRSIRWNFNLEIDCVIQGELDSSISKAFYYQYFPYMYDDSGRVIGSKWLIIPGSGLEVDLEDDHTYIFFVENSSHVYLDSILEFIRAEPLEKLSEVNILLNQINSQED